MNEEFFSRYYSRLIDRYSHIYSQHPASLAFMPLAYSFFRLGRVEEAIGISRAGVESRPDHFPAKIQLAKFLFDSGQTNEAREILTALGDRTEGNYLARSILAEIFVIQKQYPAALSLLESLIPYYPYDKTLRGRIGRLRAEMETASSSGSITAEEMDVPPAYAGKPFVTTSASGAISFGGVDLGVFEESTADPGTMEIMLFGAVAADEDKADIVGQTLEDVLSGTAEFSYPAEPASAVTGFFAAEPELFSPADELAAEPAEAEADTPVKQIETELPDEILSFDEVLGTISSAEGDNAEIELLLSDVVAEDNSADTAAEEGIIGLPAGDTQADTALTGETSTMSGSDIDALLDLQPDTGGGVINPAEETTGKEAEAENRYASKLNKLLANISGRKAKLDAGKKQL